MKALVVTEEHKLECWDIPMPQIGDYEALVNIKACGICSTTDREIIAANPPFDKEYPGVLGHEAVGEVIEVGSKVRKFAVGDLVTRAAAIWPGETRDGVHSIWGGFAEYGIVRDLAAAHEGGSDAVPADWVGERHVVLPPGLDLRQAVLSIALAETASWFWYLPPVGGKTVCVAGTGIAGLSIAIWSKLAGARVIVLGRRQVRLDLAVELGADDGVNVTEEDVPARVRELNDGEGVDFFVEAAGKNDQVRVGLSVIKPGGLVAVYGTAPGYGHDLTWSYGPLPASISHYPTEEHKGSPWVTQLLGRGYILTDKLMTHAWPLAEYEAAFAAVAAGEVVKGMLEM